MRISSSNNDINRPIKKAPKIQIEPDIGSGVTFQAYFWRDGGIGDNLFAYAILKAFKTRFPNASITYLTPTYNFASQIFQRQRFCKLQFASYSEIHKKQRSWHQYDFWSSIRPKTFSIISEKITNTSEILLDSLNKQVELYGKDYFKDPWGTVESRPIYGEGKMDALSVYKYIHNISPDFLETTEIFVNNPEFLKTKEKFQDDYFTVHQWAYLGREGYNVKFWPLSYWKELISLLKREFDMPIYQLGGKEETLLSPDVVDYRGVFPFMGSAGILSNTKCHIDIEGSLIHTCGSLGTPHIALAGPSSKYWQHLNMNYLIAKGSCNKMPCEDSIDGWHNKCPEGHHRCMEQLSPELVFEKIKEQLK